MLSAGQSLTHRRWLVAEVAVLVSLQQTLGLGLGSGSAGQPLVEAHDLLHANSIGGSSNRLDGPSVLLRTKGGQGPAPWRQFLRSTERSRVLDVRSDTQQDDFQGGLTLGEEI